MQMLFNKINFKKEDLKFEKKLVSSHMYTETLEPCRDPSN